VKIVLLGATGQLGFVFRKTLASLGNVTALGRAELDLSDPSEIRTRLRALQPQLVVNAAAYTAVDRAEDEASLARILNADLPQVLGEEASLINAAVVHFSTDYVFSGEQAVPYREHDPACPLGVYGQSKLEGEQRLAASGAAHLIFRTTWLYGPRGRNFLLAILRRAQSGAELRVVSDQFGSPTCIFPVAEAVTKLLGSLVSDRFDLEQFRNVQGLYHMTNSGSTTWHGFAVAILEAMREYHGWPEISVRPIQSGEFPTRAIRPKYSVLSNELLALRFGLKLPDWRESLRSLIRHPEYDLAELASHPPAG